MELSSEHRPFFGVEQSLRGQRWVERLAPRQRMAAEAIAQKADVPELIARVLAARGVEEDEAEAFLQPKLRDLMPDPSTLTDMDRASDRLARAIKDRRRIAIFGDYDVDGATSSALMKRFLDHCGIESEIYIPDRIFEGYGPNPAAISELAERGAGLIVCVDCGSTSYESIAQAQTLGVDVIVFDHHQVGDDLPQTAGLVNPNRQDDLSGQGHLCAAGVVFLALVATNRSLRQSGFFDGKKKPPNLMGWLDLVALGTVCDVVPLKGLNRAFIARGLDVFHARSNPGLSALARISRLDGPPSTYHLGFVLGPRINAGGRIGDAALGARLLSSEDPAEAETIAARLDHLNTERQAMEAAMREEAISEAESEIGKGEGPAVLVTESEHWHAGVVGLLASRLKDRFRRPAFAISFDGRGVGTGSGRSVAGVDLGAAVREAVDEGLLEKGGGHVMAVGITIKREKLGAFRAFLETMLGEDVREQQRDQVQKIDGALTARGANHSLYELVEQAGPYGAGHAQPIFALPNHTIEYSTVVGKQHVKATISAGDGARLDAIAFRAVGTPLGEALLSGQGNVFHFAGSLSANFWQGRTRMQLRIVDMAQVPDRI
ncbi:MAG: single-stranded-DNA-specific exonuclease RecJ [Pseudomonadota bacterium]